ncbi:MAG: 3-oxoacyl-ACP reductase FabG, partial [Hyphomicrobiales bacterium]|nr:3-oxoacyl-ACP reductase FabG [Hyphomicrobiales bacterium]
MSEFEGKVVLITGGTRGIGRGCAEAFAQAGAKVAICGRDQKTAEDAASAIAEATGADVKGFAADVGNSESVDALVAAVRETCGPVYVLVNNAGITRDGLLMRMKNEDWDAVMDTNLNGVFYLCRAVSRDMLKQRAGRIINISSIIGLRGQAGQANYAAAKAGLLGFTKSLARELGSRGVTANVVCPGYIETDMTAVIGEDLRKELLSRIPLNRVGQAED